MEEFTFMSNHTLGDLYRRSGGGSSEPSRTPGEIARTWIAFSVVTLASKLVGPYFPLIGLPLITGYIVVGAVIGPFSLKIITQEEVASLAWINMFALAYISTSAGAELHIHELKPLFKGLVAQTTGIACFTFALCTIVVGLLSSTSLLAWINPYPNDCRWAVAMVMASICIARSPATAIALVKELKCRGVMTSTMLGITVLSDLFVLISVTITVSYAGSSCKGMPFQGASLGIVIAMIIVSLLIGVIIGYMFMLLMIFSRFFVRALVFPLGFLVFLCSSIFAEAVAKELPEDKQLHLEPLLMCIVGGFVCVNFSSFHHRFCDALQIAAPYIFLPFFTLVGASLDLKTFVNSIGFAVIVAVVRACCIFMGTSGAGWAVGQAKALNLTIWMTLISQAGFSLGLAAQVASKFDGWGRKFQAVIISVVVVNQIAGPILCKLALRWSGETGRATGNEAQDEEEADPHAVHFSDRNKALVIGCTPMSKALSITLLKERWGVVMLTSDEKEMEEVREIVNDWAEELRTEEISCALQSGLEPPPAPAVPIEDNFHAMAMSMDLEEELGKKQKSISGGSSTSSAPTDVKVEVAKGSNSPRVSAATRESLGTPAETPPGSPAMSPRKVVPIVEQTGVELKSWKAEKVETKGYEQLETTMDSACYLDRCSELFNLMDRMEGLQSIVLAMDNDLNALALLEAVQEFLTEKGKTLKICVLMQELRWTEAFAILDAIPIHDFVSQSRVAASAVTAQYNKDVVLLPASTSAGEMSRAYFGLFDGPQLSRCCPAGRVLRAENDLVKSGENPSSKLLSVLRARMTERRTKLSGGRMLKAIENWMQRNLPSPAVSPMIRPSFSSFPGSPTSLVCKPREALDEIRVDLVESNRPADEPAAGQTVLELSQLPQLHTVHKHYIA